MVMVEVGLSVHDLHLISDAVEITEHEAPNGAPVFQGDLQRLDFAVVRVGFDIYKIIKARKRLPGYQLGTHSFLHGSRASIIDSQGREF